MRAPLPIAEAFAIFENPRNLARITPPALHFRIVTPGRIVMRRGAEIEYGIRVLGIPVHWKTLITRYDPPRLFEDEQASGPYKFWRHLHTFEEGPGGTLIADRVEYALPFGPLGGVAQVLMVGRQLRGIFEFRQRALIPILGGDPAAYQLEPVAILRE